MRMHFFLLSAAVWVAAIEALPQLRPRPVSQFVLPDFLDTKRPTSTRSQILPKLVKREDGGSIQGQKKSLKAFQECMKSCEARKVDDCFPTF